MKLTGLSWLLQSGGFVYPLNNSQMNVAPDWKKMTRVHSKGEFVATLIGIFISLDIPAQALRQPSTLETAMTVIGITFPPKPGQFTPWSISWKTLLNAVAVATTIVVVAVVNDVVVVIVLVVLVLSVAVVDCEIVVVVGWTTQEQASEITVDLNWSKSGVNVS